VIKNDCLLVRSLRTALTTVKPVESVVGTSFLAFCWTPLFQKNDLTFFAVVVPLSSILNTALPTPSALQLLSQAHISRVQRKGTTNTEWKLAAFHSYRESADLVPSYGRIPARWWDMRIGSCVRDVLGCWRATGARLPMYGDLRLF
jgi:hypothetical protein